MTTWSFFLLRTALITLPALLGACGGGGLGDATSTTSTPLPASGPQAPTLALTPTAIRTFRFSWADVAGETEYRLLEDPDGTSGFTPVATLPADSTRHELEVFLPERVNARYLLQACQASVCADSAVVHVSGHLAEAIGYFKSSNPTNRDEFGASMAFSANGQTLAVAAPGNGATNSNSGTVYIFTREGTTWRQQGLLKAPAHHMGDFFGFGLALSSTGDTLAVGAPQNSETTFHGGAAFVFRRNGDVWSLPTRITGLNTGGGDRFGSSVALSGNGDTLAVGASDESSSATGINGPDNDNSDQSGAAYVFTYDGTHWEQKAYVKASHTQAFSQLGRRLALSADGRTLAVSAMWDGSVVPFSGTVYIFVHDGATWSEQAHVKAINPGSFERYGEAIALSANGDVLAVGNALESSFATGIDGDGNNDSAHASGAVYVYARNGVTWSRQAYVKASNTQADDMFGISLALSADGRSLAVGASGEDSAARGIGGDQTSNANGSAGATYLFKHTPTGWRQESYIKASNTVDNHVYRFGMAMALSGDGQTLAVGCPWATNASAGVGGNQDDTSGWNVGAVYLY